MSAGIKSRAGKSQQLKVEKINLQKPQKATIINNISGQSIKLMRLDTIG